MKNMSARITQEQYDWIKKHNINFSAFVRNMLKESMKLETIIKSKQYTHKNEYLEDMAKFWLDFGQYEKKKKGDVGE